MKKLLVISILTLVLALPGLVQAQSWRSTNQVTIAWDAVSLPAGASGTVAYDVYTVGALAAKSTAAKVTRVTTTTAIITFTAEGKYFVGVRTVRIDGGSDVAESAIAWSDDPLSVSTAGTFGIVYYVAPAAIKNLRTAP